VVILKVVNPDSSANFGGGVYKQRIARPGAGKSGGYRAIMYFRSGERTFFVYGFAKSKRDNTTTRELKALRESARENLNLTDEQLAMRIKAGYWKELD
jgi:hypothetical protein